MVVKGKIRGNGRQLASYLLTQNENEEIRILDVDGQAAFTEQDVRDMLGDFSLNELLTKSRQGIYHASINPPDEIASAMTDEQWLMATDILAAELGFSNQRHAVVYHRNKMGRGHIHIAFERYDHEKGIMIPIPHNYRKHDKARAKLEKIFNDQPTPEKNPNRKAMKEALTTLWQENREAKTFLKAAKQQGYVIAEGYERGQHMVIDQEGRSFKLVSHLKGVRVRDVRERFKDTVLIKEKDALAFANTRKMATVQQAKTEAVQPGREDFLKNLAQVRSRKQSNKPRMH